MKIVVIGASGRIGEKLVFNLRKETCSVEQASRSFGVDSVTGIGLERAMSDANVIVDTSDSPSSDSRAALSFFETSSRNLLAAGREAGARHHIALSIVGLERLLNGQYFAAKKAQEDLIKASGVPYTILRATQFFELVSDVAQRSTGSDVPIPPVLVQPISSDDIADALASLALGRPMNRMLEIAGPQQLRFDELAASILVAYEDPRRVVSDPKAPYYGVELGNRSLLPGADARIASARFDDWLRQTLQPTAAPMEWRRRA
jgi:uncharacterized protein YbjT (DUF2867 family)